MRLWLSRSSSQARTLIDIPLRGSSFFRCRSRNSHMQVLTSFPKIHFCCPLEANLPHARSAFAQYRTGRATTISNHHRHRLNASFFHASVRELHSTNANPIGAGDKCLVMLGAVQKLCTLITIKLRLMPLHYHIAGHHSAT